MRIVGFLFRLFLGTALLVWLAGQAGTAHLTWNDYAFETSTAFLIMAVLVLGGVFLFVYRLVRFIKDGPRFWRLRQKIQKMKAGQDKLGAGLVALAAGNATEAGRLATLARKQLGENPATQFLQACAAGRAGDRALAHTLFVGLTASGTGAALGYRGLIIAAMQDGNWAEVDRLAALWLRIEPATPWVQGVVFQSAVRRRDWRAAHQALVLGRKAKLWPAARVARAEAALLLAVVDQEHQAGHPKQALEAAEKAAGLIPTWLPARLVLAQEQVATDHLRAAERTIENAWRVGPHPMLITLLRACGPVKKPLETYKKVEKLTRLHRDSPVARHGLAEAALDADLWGEARRLLITLVQQGAATQTTYRLLARLERRESGKEAAAIAWLAKAVDALPEPVWLCGACGGTHAAWQPSCAHCGAFDRLEWQTPGVARMEQDLPFLAAATEGLLG